jgi:hypothetical protein
MTVDIPSKYTLGGTIEIDLTTYDTNNIVFIPSESRLSVKDPVGAILTVSGDAFTATSGSMQFYIYRPPYTGWYEYEIWVKDNSGREVVKSRGFDVVDRVY